MHAQSLRQKSPAANAEAMDLRIMTSRAFRLQRDLNHHVCAGISSNEAAINL
jgi:hypothetical protein